jgi:hypothetical protein
VISLDQQAIPVNRYRLYSHKDFLNAQVEPFSETKPAEPFQDLWLSG